MTVRIGVLGPVQVAGHDAGGAATRALIAALVVGTDRPGSARSVAALADDIWGEDQPQNPRGAVQTLISRLRAAGGGDLVVSAPGGYALSAETDLDRARSLLRDAAEAGRPRRLDLLDEALGLWRGEPGADLGDAPIAQVLDDEAAGLRAEIRAARAGALADAGRHTEAVMAFEALADARPLDEAVHLGLMSALVAASRTADAIAVYGTFRARLRDVLGSSPGSTLTELNARLLRDQEAPRVRVGLRAAPNDLIGRDRVLAEAIALIGRVRLVTILGVGGLGKTRMAQAVAAAVETPVVVFVPLAGVRADADVPLAIGAALGISEATPGGRFSEPRSWPDLRARITAALADRATLLVLDNCEQVIDGVADWAADLLAAVPTLSILATSRSPLAIAAEHVLPLPPLTIAVDPEAPAVRLFLERARAARPDASLDPMVLARLCAHLDGLPLAIELAAARVRTMTPEQIESRLQDRFALLTSGDRTAPERHRTLEAVIAWSWDLVDEEAQHALTVLSLLPGGFSAATAAAVLGRSVDDLMDRLAEQSLLVVSETRDARVRFRMLETVREFGLNRLAAAGADAESAGWDAVLGWARAFAEDHARHGLSFPGALSPAAHREVGAEHDNLVMVLRRLLESGDAADVVKLFAVLGQSWFMRGAYSELIGVSGAVLAAARTVPVDEVPLEAIAMTMTVATVGCLIVEDPRGLRGLAALRALERTAGSRMSPAWRGLVTVMAVASRESEVGAVLDGLRASQDTRARLAGEVLIAHFAENLGEPELAMTAAVEAWEHARELGEPWTAAMAADAAAQLSSQSARPAEAMVWTARAEEGFLAYDATDQLRQMQWLRGGILLGLDRSAEARALFTDLTQTGELAQDGLEMGAIGWYGLAEAHRLAGELEETAEAYQRAMAMFRTNDQRRSPWYLMAVAGYITAGAHDLDLDPVILDRWVRRLRGRAVAGYRLRPDVVDRPVLGTVLLGWSAWALTRPGLQGSGLEALAIAEALGARQDMPSMRLAEHFDRARRLVGDDAVEKARAEVATLSPPERIVRGYALLDPRG
ncbi:putative ATPase/DNA-binding SARP family transcriptional activator [Microbacterium resistens]|uniref:ATPase/DNA-binding SARP family transcriptional activator n=1 Tax=Microbacterium resistens TaxID=156977 RepID=A0ABU1SGC5_9MICO|nr:BTAD domain-containing putative transcriptional regulator [Microbacterium resistens]MDR6868660.1 putative ATPase/DNA-binding SARP family transcriptional activator [Microbacterium resistens]